MKQERFEKAKAFFADPKNAEVNKLYFTSDENTFKAKHFADSWSRGLKDTAVYTVHRYLIEALDVGNDEKVIIVNGESAEDLQASIEAAKTADKPLLVVVGDSPVTEPKPEIITVIDTQQPGAESTDQAESKELNPGHNPDEKTGNKEPETEGEATAGADEREALVKRYIELFDTKPAHNTGIAKLKERIAEKEAENAKNGIED